MPFTAKQTPLYSGYLPLRIEKKIELWYPELEKRDGLVSRKTFGPSVFTPISRRWAIKSRVANKLADGISVKNTGPGNLILARLFHKHPRASGILR